MKEKEQERETQMFGWDLFPAVNFHWQQLKQNEKRSFLEDKEKRRLDQPPLDYKM